MAHDPNLDAVMQGADNWMPPPSRRFPHLTKKEWFELRMQRGMSMTGFPSHTCEVSGKARVYYWPMGRQPDAEWIATYSAKCPIKAAEKFLSRYEKGEHRSSVVCFAQPVPRKAMS